MLIVFFLWGLVTTRYRKGTSIKMIPHNVYIKPRTRLIVVVTVKYKSYIEYVIYNFI